MDQGIWECLCPGSPHNHPFSVSTKPSPSYPTAHYPWFLLSFICFLYVVLLDMAPDEWPRHTSHSPPCYVAVWVLGLQTCTNTPGKFFLNPLLRALWKHSTLAHTWMFDFNQWKYFFSLETQWSLEIILFHHFPRQFQAYPHLQLKLRLMLLWVICNIPVTQYS